MIYIILSIDLKKKYRKYCNSSKRSQYIQYFFEKVSKVSDVLCLCESSIIVELRILTFQRNIGSKVNQDERCGAFDISFASIISAWPEKYSSKWIQFFKRYINKSKYNALFGDTLYVIAWSISFYFVEKYIKSFSLKIFIISLFLFLTSAYSVK